MEEASENNDLVIQNQQPKAWKWVRIVPSGVWLAFLTAMFFLQEHAYRSGYLKAIGANIPDFKESFHEYFWYAYRGWSDLIIIMLNKLSDINSLFSPAFLVIWGYAVIIILFLLYKKKIEVALTPLGRNFDKIVKTQKKWPEHASKALIALTLPFYLFVFPIIIVAIVLVVFVEGFQSLGHQRAMQNIEHPRYIVKLKEGEGIELNAIECSPSHCIVINGKHTKMVSRSRIIYQRYDLRG